MHNGRLSRRDFLRNGALCLAACVIEPGVSRARGLSNLLGISDPSLLPSVSPSVLRGVYVPGWRAVSRASLEGLAGLVDEAGLTCLMVDLKNARGEVFFQTLSPLGREINCRAVTREGRAVSVMLDGLLDLASRKGLRLVARHVMFRDERLFGARPDLRLWEKPPQKWVDLKDRRVLDYNMSLLAEETALGFDEIVLDYIRFPAAPGFGPDQEKCAVIDRIVEEAASVVRKGGLVLGVQVFGYAAWDQAKAGVGQRLETLDPFVDAIYPMLYPSHFWPGSFGYQNPVEHPGEFVGMGCRRALEKISGSTRIVPMIQAFSYSHREIMAQVEAAERLGMPGYVFWNPSGRYDPLLPPDAAPPDSA